MVNAEDRPLVRFRIYETWFRAPAPACQVPQMRNLAQGTIAGDAGGWRLGATRPAAPMVDNAVTN